MGRHSAAAVLLLVMIVSVFSVVCTDDSDASSPMTPVISELDPYVEGFTIYNPTSIPIDLKGYRLTDGEGTLNFTKSLTISAGGSLVFVETKGTDWFSSRSGVIVYGEKGTEKVKAFTFANSGDELYLYDSANMLLDTVCYGSSKGGDGWTGPAVSVSSGHYLLRTKSVDTDTSADWMSVKPGWSNLEFSLDLEYGATVTPFTFPESQGIPVLKALASAETSIDLSIYLVSSPNVAALLVELAENGVQVRILIEGEPLGVNTNTELSYLKAIQNAGAEVRVINDGDNTRYSYVHNKYAVIDSDTVVITSENWTAGNIGTSGNRGWGAVIESPGYAHYMEGVFNNDFSTEWKDVKDLSELYPSLVAYAGLYYVSPGDADYASYAATVTPVLSPDNSFSALREFMSTADERLYVEEMDLGTDLASTTGDTPVSWMAEATTRGADVRFILDSSQASGSAHEEAVEKINLTTSIKAVAVDGRKGLFSLIHNKGIIADDSVWVGSVNWTRNSFMNNRETAVIISSKEVSDYYAKYFLEDFGVTIDTVQEDGLSFKVRVADTSEGTVVLLSALGPAGYEYEWDPGYGTVKKTSNAQTFFMAPEPGDYVARVTLVGTSISEEVSYHVDAPASSGPIDSLGSSDKTVIYLLSACVFLLGLIVTMIRRAINGGRGRKRSGRGNTRNASRRR